MDEGTGNKTFSVSSHITHLLNMTSTELPPLNQTGDFSNLNYTNGQSGPPLYSVDEEYGLSTTVTVAIALGSAVVLIIISE